MTSPLVISVGAHLRVVSPPVRPPPATGSSRQMMGMAACRRKISTICTKPISSRTPTMHSTMIGLMIAAGTNVRMIWS